MKIAIIGAGNVGGALASRLSEKHEILVGTRDGQPLEKLSKFQNVNFHTNQEAAQSAEAIIVALPVPAVVEVANQLGNLSGKVLIDATNSVFGKPEPYQTGFEAFLKINGAEVCKGFNTTGFENMLNPVYNGEAIEMFTAGDSQKAKDVFTQLAQDVGFGKVYDFGGNDKVALIEQFAMSWINLAIMQKEGRNIAFRIERR